MMDKNLMMTICLCLGVLCWAVAAYFAIRYRKDVKSIIRAAGLGVFASLFFFIYPYSVVQSGVFAVPFTLLQVIASAVVASDPLAVFECIGAEYSVPFLAAYQAVLIVLHAVAPLFTIGITLSFFESKFAEAIYRVRASRRESHIFSDINERTLCLAESIYETNKKSIFAFIGTKEQLEEQRDFAERVKNVRGYIVELAPSEIKHSLRHKRTYYLLKPNGSKNLKDAISLYEKYDKVGGEKINIWLYSKDDISTAIFDNLDEKIDIRLINEEQLIAMELLRKYPIYTGIKENKLVFLLVGAGHIGMEILKNALWCSRFGEGMEAEFHVFDLYASAQAAKLEKQCPGLAEQYNVKFYDVNVETDSFIKALESIKPTYIVATTGDEQRNIRVSADLRRFYGFDGDFPLIHILLDHEDTKTMIIDNLKVCDWKFSKESKTFERTQLCSYSLLPFGSYAETYSSVRFSKGYFDMLAMAANAARFGITKIDNDCDAEKLRDMLNKVEYYKNFSYAYATSIPYKLWLMGLEFVEDGLGELSVLEEMLPTYEKHLVEQETERWNCYMRTQGWKPFPIDEVTDGVYHDKMRKLNARLDTENIDRLAELVGRDFDRENTESIYRLPTIIKMANELTDTPYSVRLIKK